MVYFSMTTILFQSTKTHYINYMFELTPKSINSNYKVLGLHPFKGTYVPLDMNNKISFYKVNTLRYCKQLLLLLSMNIQLGTIDSHIVPMGNTYHFNSQSLTTDYNIFQQDNLHKLPALQRYIFLACTL